MVSLPSVALGYEVVRYGLAADDAEGMHRYGGPDPPSCQTLSPWSNAIGSMHLSFAAPSRCRPQLFRACHPRLDRGSPYTELIADTIPITLSPRIKVGEPVEPFRGRLTRNFLLSSPTCSGISLHGSNYRYVSHCIAKRSSYYLLTTNH